MGQSALSGANLRKKYKRAIGKSIIPLLKLKSCPADTGQLRVFTVVDSNYFLASK
jgi:hypothetical protein